MKVHISAATVVALIASADVAFDFDLHPDADCVKNAAPSHRQTSIRATEVYAVWYDVPRASLARRRAGEAELTAAHNRLPIGALVRVTNPKNDKSVVVRITDRGITNRRAKIDICKEAAQEIGMLRDGIARVRLEVLDLPRPAKGAGTNRVAAKSIAE
jgi:rare lipoprotein A (peptidoglycan hydrolase)